MACCFKNLEVILGVEKTGENKKLELGGLDNSMQ